LRILHATVKSGGRLVRELSRRHVFKVAAAYAAIAFVGIQVADLTYPVLHFPAWAYNATVIAFLIGAPIVLVISWIYDLTSEGLRRTASLDEPEPEDSGGLVPRAVYAPRSVAILPFRNLSADPDNEYFSDGITEDIIARASRIRDLKVISRTSVMQYKGSQKNLRLIGRELGVATLLEGSVRRTDNRIRVVAQLIDARSDAHRWTETYDRVIEDIFEIQTDIANQIAAALQAELSPEEMETVADQPTENLEAYDLYLRARHEWNRRTTTSLVRSAEMLKQVLELDPRFALAWAALADTYVSLGVYGAKAPADVMPAARHAAEEALRINSTLGEALTALGSYHAAYDLDFRSAERAFSAAMEMNPQYTTAPQWYALNALVPLQRFNEAEKLMARACELDPLSPIMTVSLGVLEYYKGDYGLTVELCEAVLELHPRFGIAYFFLGLGLEQQGRLDEAIGALQKSVELSDWSTEAVAGLAHAYAAAGREVDARKLLATLETEAAGRYVSPGFVAQVHVALGDYDTAFALLEKARALRSVDLLWLGVRPTFAPLRTDPRFAKLLSALGLDRTDQPASAAHH
jgi:TolB-like protein